MIVTGAFSSVLGVCNQIMVDRLVTSMDAKILEEINNRFSDWSNQGFRVLGVAQKSVPIKNQDEYTIEDEQCMIFMGFLLFFDPPKEDVIQTITDLNRLGVQLRIITGDNKLVALYTANAVGLKVSNVLTGADLINMNDESLWNIIENTNLFAEVDPNQKERIILALKRRIMWLAIWAMALTMRPHCMPQMSVFP